MKTRSFENKYYFITIFLLLFALMFVACDGGSETDGEGAGGMGDVETDAPGDATFPEDSALDEPIIVDPEPTEEVAAPLEEPTATVDPLLDVEPTPETDILTDTQEMMGETRIPQVILASDLVGMDITNEGREEVGEVSELLVSPDGTIQYVLFDVGGFLGIGDKTIALTWDNFEIRHEDEIMMGETTGADETMTDADLTEVDIDNYKIVYTGMAADLESLPEFDTSILDEDGYILNEPSTTTDTEFDASPYVGFLQVGEFEDYNLLNMEDEDLGEVEDLLINVSEGRVAYAVIDFGGFLGIAETSVAAPWDRLTFEQDTETFRLDVDEANLEAAPLFDFSTWEYPLEDNWDTEYQTYWSGMS
jgi:sporulation protein YlmC with PRC-barrel domain